MTTMMIMITINQNEGIVTFHKNWGRNIIDKGLKYSTGKIYQLQK